MDHGYGHSFSIFFLNPFYYHSFYSSELIGKIHGQKKPKKKKIWKEDFGIANSLWLLVIYIPICHLALGFKFFLFLFLFLWLFCQWKIMFLYYSMYSPLPTPQPKYIYIHIFFFLLPFLLRGINVFLRKLPPPPP